MYICKLSIFLCSIVYFYNRVGYNTARLRICDHVHVTCLHQQQHDVSVIHTLTSWLLPRTHIFFFTSSRPVTLSLLYVKSHAYKTCFLIAVQILQFVILHLLRIRSNAFPVLTPVLMLLEENRITYSSIGHAKLLLRLFNFTVIYLQ